jgi:hypothetical protein
MNPFSHPQNNVAASAGTVHDPHTFDGHSPTAEQVAIWPNSRPDALQCLAIQSGRVVTRVFHRRFLKSVFAGDYGLAVNFEIFVAPA